MSITLHVFPPSPRAFKVMAVANQLGVDFEIRLVNLATGDHQQPAYAALNPNMRMPTLTEGDFVLWESNAICQYLASKNPGAGLKPAEPRASADVARWMFWESQHWDPAAAAFIFQNLVKPLFGIGSPDPAALTAAEPPFHRAAKVLDTHLAGKTYVAGGKLSLADFAIGACMICAGAAQFPISGYSEIKRWYAGIEAQPGWQKALQQRAAFLPKAA